ncbi:insulin-degrading enzyme-like [Rhopilema esculentum]|uniref:insulin-degrading enzyme-like n=1 Tax=Rhopilema esculentum TaxID=499914 RepID=UPI0031E2B429|eukprot:gene598-10290_t
MASFEGSSFEILKSCEDKRDYRGYELENKMKVLLVSDPTTEKSAASVDVHIGNLSDPAQLPGLAHFCEHMLFLGTEKYPSENAFTEFLNEHGGHSNAFTSQEHTTYYFDVRSECLLEALDRFAQFFLCPLFNEDAKDREVNAIESENQNNLLRDHWRRHQLLISTCAPDHPYNRFGTGNLQTLKTFPESEGINIRDELLKFHNDLYSANIMALVVIGRESISDLEKAILPLFSLVENKGSQVKEYLQHPLGPEQLPVQLDIVPIKDSQNLHLTFPMPDLQKHYEAKPDHYVAHLIGHEGHGSILSVLKKKGWINSLSAGSSKGAKGFSFFVVNMELTEDGIGHVDDIITSIFQYVNLLNDAGPQEWIFNEIKALDDMTFRYKDKETPYGYVTTLSHAIQMYPIEEALYAPYKMSRFDKSLIELVLSHLKPSNLHVQVTSKCHEGKTNCTEKWYGTAYNVNKIAEEKLKIWEECGLSKDFHLPPPNELIPTEFNMKAKPSDELSEVPVLLEEDDIFRVWFKQDKKFCLPKACLYFEFSSPVTFSHPRHCAMVEIFLNLLQDSLTEFSYDAELAGVSYRTELHVHGIQLRIKGYNSKQSVLLKKIVERLVNLEMKQDRFDVMKEKIQRKLKNFEAEQPHMHAIFYMSYLLSEQAWDKVEILQTLADVTLEKLKAFIPEFLGQMHVECLIAGNLTKEEGREIVHMVSNLMKENSNTKALFPLQRIRQREVQLPDGAYYIYERKHKVQNNSCIEVYYQTEMQCTRSNATLELFSQLIADKCFDQLRTQEQLGYIVFSGVRRANGVQGLRFIIQSEKNPAILDERIEAFLSNAKEIVQNLTDKEFQNHVNALIMKKLEEPKKLSDECSKYWNEITTKEYNFRRPIMEAEELRKIEKHDVVNFYESLLSSTAPQRHKISVYILGNGSKEHKNVQEAEEPQTGPEYITDVLSFKSSLPLFPVLRSTKTHCKTKAKL